MHITCEMLKTELDLPAPPRRVVSLVSAATETIATLGCKERLVGVSPYCGRYVTNLDAPVVGDYLKAAPERLHAVAPDLVLVTSGVQLALGRKLMAAGLPVFVLPLPCSRFGIWQNTVTLGALLQVLPAARSLAERLDTECQRRVSTATSPRPRVYVELWFGKYLRTVGGLSFIHDLIAVAGGENIFGSEPVSYVEPDFGAVVRGQPDVAVFFSEPEYPIDSQVLIRERGWHRTLPALRVIESSVDRGRNVIHDGPSFVETAAWLQQQLQGTRVQP